MLIDAYRIPMRKVQQTGYLVRIDEVVGIDELGHLRKLAFDFRSKLITVVITGDFHR